MTDYLYESRFRRIEIAAIAMMLIGTAGGISTLAASGLTRAAAAAATVVAGAAALTRARRLRLEIRDQEIVVANYWRTYRFPPASVVELGVDQLDIGMAIPAFLFLLADGRAVHAHSTPVVDKDQVTELERIRRFLPDHTKVHLDSVWGGLRWKQLHPRNQWRL